MEEITMKNLNLKNLAVLVLVFALLLMTTACGAGQTVSDASSDTQPAQTADGASGPAAEPQSFRIGICSYVDDANTSGDGTVYKVGIVNWMDHASLNQIVENIQARLEEISAEKGVQFVIDYDNCNADATVMEQIIANFQSSGADLLVGVATPVAMRMQTATEDSQTPVVFAAVSDPIGAGLVESLDAPGSNVTGTSDYLDTAAVMKLIFAADPDASKIGLLYDAGQDSSTAAIASAKAYLDENGIEYVEHTGSTADEVMLAAQAMVADGVDAIFTPTDNSIMKAELAIYETFIDAGIPQYTGADSFALNGAFLGYGVDYANLGRETADMIADILLNSADPSSTPVRTFDNGTATINTETCAGLGLDFDALSQAFAPYCTKIATLTTAESFS